MAINHYYQTIKDGLDPEEARKLENIITATDKADHVRHTMDYIVRAHAVWAERGVFVQLNNKKLITRDAFNMTYNPIATLLDYKPYRSNAAKFALDQAACRRVAEYVYQPERGDWIDGNKFNMWRGPGFEPLNESPALFLDHVNYLVPDEEERELVLDWLAWCVQHPDQKLQYALLMYGIGGTGKSWFSLLFQALFGDWNVTHLENADTLTKDMFNGSLANRRIVFMDEVAPEGKFVRGLTEYLKGVITSKTLTIRVMYKDSFPVQNVANVFGVSNHPNAIKMQGVQDRRWGVVQATSHLRHADENNIPTDATRKYYRDLFAVTNVGAKPDEVDPEVRRILHWLKARDLSGFDGRSVAPMTQAKIDMTAYTMSDGQQRLNDMFAERSGPFAFTLFTVAEVADALPYGRPADADAEKSRLARVASWLGELGAVRIGNRAYMHDGSGKRARYWVRSRFEADAEPFRDMQPPDLTTYYQFERDMAPKPTGGKPNGSVLDGLSDDAF